MRVAGGRVVVTPRTKTLSPDLHRFIEADAADTLVLLVPDIEAMMAGEVPVPDRLGGKNPRFLHGVRHGSLAVEQFGAFVVDRHVVVVNVEKVSRHGSS